MPRKILLIGAAHAHTPDHIETAEALGWKIGAVADRDGERRARVAQQTGADEAPTLGPGSLEGFDAAIVCSETVHREADIFTALALGLPVLTEKPLAPNAATARRLARLFRDARQPLCTNYFLRTNSTVCRLVKAIRDGTIGEVSSARLRFSHDGGYADWLDLDTWMTDPAQACMGGFADEGVHVIDLALWALGPLTARGAVMGHALGYEVDDHGTGLLRTSRGAPVTIEAGWTDTEMRLEAEAIGTEGRARLCDGALTVRRRDGTCEIENLALAKLDAGEGTRAFLSALDEGGDPCFAPPDAAVSVAEALDALDLRSRAEE